MMVVRRHLLASLVLILSTWTGHSVQSRGDKLDHSRSAYHIEDYRTHSCVRPCRGDSPQTCRYYFVIEHFTTLSPACLDCPSNHTHCLLPQCVTGDGQTRPILTVNRMMPGPAIQVCKGDTIEVLLDNKMLLSQGTSIHWHGIKQLGTPHMDGTSLVTQCPIHAGSQMTYRFKAIDSGTYFWHSHASVQRTDGLYGGLVVRAPRDQDAHGQLYDFDLPEHLIILSDWSSTSSAEAFTQDIHAGNVAEPSSILVNGFGNYKNGPPIPLQTFRVKPGGRYRFRVIYNGNINCPVTMSVDQHPMLMIASDGRNFEPLEVDVLMILSGERYDFILKAKPEVKDTFWIRFKGHGRCTGRKIFQAAVLQYEGASRSRPQEEATFENTEDRDSDRILNGRNGKSSNTSFQVTDLKSVARDDYILKHKPDKKFYISLAASQVVDTRFTPPIKQNSSTVRPVNPQFNYISSHLPPSPPLSQFSDIPKDLFCNNETVAKDCTQTLCLCVHLLSFDYNDIVEIVMVSFTNTLIHPIHMHGHTFRVLAMQGFDHDLTVQQVKDMDKKGQIRRTVSRAAYKDTISVNAQSVVVIRFQANNPGFWLFHCHIEFHTEMGMLLILQSGKLHQIPEPPENFPACGNWKPQSDRLVGVVGKQPTQEEDRQLVQTLGISISAGCVVIAVIAVVLYKKRKGRSGNLCGRGADLSPSYQSLM